MIIVRDKILIEDENCSHFNIDEEGVVTYGSDIYCRHSNRLCISNEACFKQYCKAAYSINLIG